jgi:hypothetical protein
LAMHGHVARCVDSQPHLLPPRINDQHRDLITNSDSLANAPSTDKHVGPVIVRGADYGRVTTGQQLSI